MRSVALHFRRNDGQQYMQYSLLRVARNQQHICSSRFHSLPNYKPVVEAVNSRTTFSANPLYIELNSGSVQPYIQHDIFSYRFYSYIYSNSTELEF
jgi:hypothetical protein